MEYSIKEAAQHLGLTPHTLRYYEQEGLLPALKRDQHNNRIYSEGDIEWLRFIRCLRDTDMSIAEMKNFVELSLQGEHTVKERLQILQEHKRHIEEKLVEMTGFLEKINGKVAWYQGMLQQRESAR